MRALLLTCSLLGATEPWTKADYTVQVALTAALVADWGQTLHIQRSGPYGFEQNPVLGTYPSRARVNTYFAASIATTWIVADQLDAPWRRVFQVTLLLVEMIVLRNNHMIGFQVRF